MNFNELDVHKSTLFLCLYNSFLKKSTLQYFSAVVRAVSPEEICRGIFFFTHFIFIRKSKLRCLTVSPFNLHLICKSFLSFNLPNIEQLGYLSRKLNQRRIVCCHFLSFTCLECV